MIPPIRSILNFPMRPATTITLFGAAVNLSLVVTAIAIPRLSLLAAALINTSIFLIAAYYSRKYTFLQINFTTTPPAYGPYPSFTLDGYTVTNERPVTPFPNTLSASMVAPALQLVPQASLVNNSGTQALNVTP